MFGRKSGKTCCGRIIRLFALVTALIFYEFFIFKIFNLCAANNWERYQPNITVYHLRLSTCTGISVNPEYFWTLKY